VSLRSDTITQMISDGWVLFPLQKNSKRPPEGTSGHLSWTLRDSQDFMPELTSDDFNVGIVTGKASGIVVIDIDPKHGGTKEAVDGIAGLVTRTRTHRTPSGGFHLIFRYPDGVEHVGNSVGRLAPGVDVRADGGYVVAPTSRLDGTDYEVVDSINIADLPPAILNKILPIDREVPDSHYQYPEDQWEDVVRWHRMNVEEAKKAQEGERDDTAYRMLVRSFQLAHTVPDSVLSMDSVTEDFRKKVPYTLKGLSGKVERAWQFAEVTPRPHPSVSIPPRASDGTGKTTPGWIKVTDYTPSAETLDDERLTDSGNANRLVEIFKDRIRYCEGIGWLIWNGKVWMPENENSASVLQMVKEAQEYLYEDLAELLRNGASAKLAKNHIRYSLSHTGLQNAMKLMQATYTIRLTAEDLDSHTHLLTVTNGVVDLRSGMLYDHRPELHMTQLVNIVYDPEAEAPRWEQFLQEVMPEMPDMPAFLQRLVGYGITGEVSEHAMAIHYGRGSNGKSIFLDTLRSLFGAISSVADWSSFERKRDGAGGARPDLVRLRGSRLVTVNEADARASIDEAQIKRMASGDLITARALHQNEIEFKPNWLLQMATNAKPDIRGADEGIWRRVKLIPWTRFFEPHERDHGLGHTLLGEAQGILSWAVRGAVEWYASGLQEPERVRNATREYREAADILGGFIDEQEHGGWLVPEENKKVPSAWAFTLYKTWAATQGYSDRDMLSQKAFKAALEERGFNTKRTMHGTVFLGLAANNDVQAVRGHTVQGAGKPDVADGNDEATVKEMF
jgi:P4 family phage/plasmid primase-like protien